ncbi:MAG: hypothetical protein N2689_07675, partial [Verrucomicrobiae bacterium]|nr:hypothetical protein [Verrucomicrobiae bacterium]
MATSMICGPNRSRMSFARAPALAEASRTCLAHLADALEQRDGRAQFPPVARGHQRHAFALAPGLADIHPLMAAVGLAKNDGGLAALDDAREVAANAEVDAEHAGHVVARDDLRHGFLRAHDQVAADQFHFGKPRHQSGEKLFEPRLLRRRVELR